ncbi:hypothetical protein K493DRAFT_48270 [Basidiobolus meristosporus CBS 931.73]|uniref:Uncharacterized protein n=1 Tax=Basidiobolus meristosporus CBS 931.73 TaxID=1314790 RepID=A0A1Y1Y1A2_9FUNG|nr:hypothetical protein K493DRAFT_48270 [Basidiobolus meristosporus CBS 931.73]|eukprot:ORX91780.1 hypothetical protein K493DRAFT_48270 [Basidiobolus meristosporus CBS 931.73]
MLYLFRENYNDDEQERIISLSNANIEIEHSTGRFMFIFCIMERDQENGSHNKTIGRLFVENDQEMKMWRVAFMERAAIQTSLGSIKTVISEMMCMSRPPTPASEFDDGYSTSSPTTPTSLHSSNLLSFHSTPPKSFTRNRQGLKENTYEVRRTRSPSSASTTKYHSELLEVPDPDATTPTAPHMNSYKIMKKTSQRFPVTFWRRRGSIV